MTFSINSNPNSTNANGKQIVAAFDFDGTLTYRDTLLPFICHSRGNLNTAMHLLGTAPALMQFLVGRKSRQEVKEILLSSAFKGESYVSLLEQGRLFSRECLGKLLNPIAIKKLRWHQDNGHRCILLSATLDVYLIPWAKKFGFQDLICSQMEVDWKGKISGKLIGLNCWGPEKMRRLEKILGPKSSYTLYAYGDSRGDQELLQAADYPFYRKF